MYADDTSMLNMRQDINELQKTTSENTGLVEQYFETNRLYEYINLTKTHYILFQMKQCRQEVYPAVQKPVHHA
jgi:penicillin-binding protein-related factor A (putative recombinase)